MKSGIFLDNLSNISLKRWISLLGSRPSGRYDLVLTIVKEEELCDPMQLSELLHWILIYYKYTDQRPIDDKTATTAHQHESM